MEVGGKREDGGRKRDERRREERTHKGEIIMHKTHESRPQNARKEPKIHGGKVQITPQPPIKPHERVQIKPGALC